MATLYIDNISPKVLERLIKRAELKSRTPSEEALCLLEQLLANDDTVQRLPDLILTDEMSAPFDLPRPGKGERVKTEGVVPTLRPEFGGEKPRRMPCSDMEGKMTASDFGLEVPSDSVTSQQTSASEQVALTDDLLAKLTPRKRAILKLRTGCLPLTEAELGKVLSTCRTETLQVKPRSLREVGVMFGISKERVRQIEQSCLKRLELR